MKPTHEHVRVSHQKEPPKQLKGYAGATLGPGQSRLVLFRLKPSDLAYVSATSGQWTVAPGRYYNGIAGPSAYTG